MTAVGLATWEGLPELSPDDQLLRATLRSDGIPATPVVWSDTAVRWEAFDLVVLRSTWDYYRRMTEFLEWVDTVARRTQLFNPASTVRWNSHKSYLKDLERLGVPIIPTVWGSEVASATDTLRARGWEAGVLKPAVSAAGVGAARITVGDREGNETAFRRLRNEGEVLLQPYLPGVDDPGEHSLVFLDGEYSHAALKAPKLSPGSSLREGVPVVATRKELAVAERALRAVPQPTLYARVDLVTDRAGDPRVMELEVIEPSLFLEAEAAAAGQLARAIERRLR